MWNNIIINWMVVILSRDNLLNGGVHWALGDGVSYTLVFLGRYKEYLFLLLWVKINSSMNYKLPLEYFVV